MKSKKPIETSLKAQSERYVSVGLAAGGFEGVDDDNNRKISNTAFAPLKFNICLGWNCQESTGFFVAKQADLHNLSRLFLFFFQFVAFVTPDSFTSRYIHGYGQFKLQSKTAPNK